MSINDISLTSGMRSNLLSLQQTVDLLNRTQNRLATGKKVNTAIDNPVSFFSAQSLNSRASKIDSLKDSMGQAIQTVTAADKGITAITSMIEQAKGIAQSPLSADNTGGTDRVALDLTTVATATPANVTLTLNTVVATNTVAFDLGGGSTVTFTANSAEWAVGGTDTITATNLASAINSDTSMRDAGYTASSAGAVVTVSKNGVDYTKDNITSSGTITSANVAAVAGDTVTIGGQTLKAGYGFFDVSGTDAEDAAALVETINSNTALQTQGFSATVDENDDTKVIISKDGVDLETNQITLGFKAGSTITASSVAAEETELSNLQDQYNAVRSQIDALAGDSGYKGKNLLDNDDLIVKFEGSSLTVEGFSATAADLGVTAAAWRTGGSTAIDADLLALDDALDTLSQNSSTLSGSLSIITVRQDFSNNMINTLTEGSDKLTLADTNEEGANMLMLQTRQSLATTALSLSSQAAQSVLRLFQ